MKTPSKVILVFYLLTIAIYTGFSCPVTIKSTYNNTIESNIQPLYLKVYEEDPRDEFKKYDWYEPAGEWIPVEKIVSVDIPKYILYFIVITTVFSAIYIMSLPSLKRE